MGFLPSKNFIASVSAVLVVFLVGWFLNNFFWNASKVEISQKTNASEQQSVDFLAAYKDTNKDSDNDGLKDWEEILWHTDPQKADTDGDGTPDGEEVKEGRDPTVAGHKLPASPSQGGPDGSWSDALSKIEKERQNTVASSTPQTLTDKIAQEFAAQYLTAVGSSQGGAVDDFQKQSVAESFVESVSKSALLYQDKFSISDVKILENASQNQVRAYLNATGDFLYKTFTPLATPETSIVNDALSSQNFEGLKKLDAYISAYQKTINFLKNESVPDGYKNLHLELMNFIENTKTADTFMKSTETDVATGLTGLLVYQKQFERGAKFYFAIANKIKSDGISFSKTEGGYHFINAIK